MRMTDYRTSVLSLVLVFSFLNSNAQSTSFTPTCGFDEMTYHYCLEDAAIQKETEHFLREVIPALASQKSSAVEPLVTVSVVVHVIHTGQPIGQGANISDQQVIDQIGILNEDFCAVNEKYHETPSQWLTVASVPNIQFLLATMDPNGQPTNGITRHNIPITGSSWSNNNINSEIKPATNWDPTRYMNVYVVSIPGTTAAGGVVGYSNYPTLSQTGGPRDGIVIDYNWFGAPGHPVSGYRALSHETGHYFGLPHPFNGTSCNDDDGIDDTPNVNDATSSYMTLSCNDGFPAGPSSCGNEHMYVNFMDYVTENCYTSFTEGQVAVMRSVLDGTTASTWGYGSRQNLLVSAPSQTVIPEHDAGITRLVSPEPTNCTPDLLTPVVNLRNFGSADLTSAKILYQVNNGPLTQFNWSGHLFPGESEEVTLAGFTPPDGQYEISFYTNDPNGQADDRPANDEFATELFTYFGFDPPLIELAEGSSSLPTPLGTYQVNFGGDDFKWEISHEASAYGFGLRSFMFDNRAGNVGNNPSDTYDLLITRHFDFSDVTDAALYFDVSYATYNNLQVDTLYILVAVNCSQNFNYYVYKKWGNELATAPPTQNTFIPMPEQWRTEGVSLSFFDGMDDVTIGFLNVSNWGNRLYIDNIRIGTDCEQLTAEWEIKPDGCTAACTGRAEVNVPVSNGDIRYEWKDQSPLYNEPFVENVCAGEVEVTILDEFGCEITVSNEIPAAQPPMLSMSSTGETGNQTEDGTATVTISGGTPPYFIEWDNGEWTLTSNLSHTITGLAAGHYEVLVIDGSNCSSSRPVTVGAACAGFSATVEHQDVSCFGLSDGYAEVTTQNGEAPFNYAWGNGVNGPTNSTLNADEHFVVVTDQNDCTFMVQFEISQPDELVIDEIFHTDATTNSSNDGTATAFILGGTQGYSFLWSNGATTASITNLSVGLYSLTVTDANGCTATGEVTIQTQAVDCDDFQTNITWENLTCYQANDGSASAFVMGQTPPVSFNWSNGTSGQTIENLPAGNYTVTVMDAAGCSAQLSADVQEPTELKVAMISTMVSMSGADDGSATATPTGGTPFSGGVYEYNWSNGGNTATINNLSPGNYIVTVTDFNGCTEVDSVIVMAAGVDCNLTIEMTTQNASCPNVADGSAGVTSVGNGISPFTYKWSTGETTNEIENLLPGNYTVTVTDAQGCTANGWVPISGNDVTPPVLVLMDEYIVLVENDNVTFDPMAVDLGSFDNCSMINLDASQTMFGCINLGENQITISATDANGNTSEETITVIVKDGLAPTINCPDDIIITGCDEVDYGPITATDNCGVPNVQLLEGLPSGTVFPSGMTTVTWEATDNGGNTSLCSFEIFVDYDFQLTDTGIKHPTCEGDADGYIDLFIVGGETPYQIIWSHGGGPTNLSAGIYTVTIADANGCTIEETFELIDPPAFNVSLVEIIPAMGGSPNGSIQVSITGGTSPFTIDWFDENGSPLPDFDPFNVPPGTYSVTATDYIGCERSLGPLVVDNLNSTTFIEKGQQINLYPNPATGNVFIKTDLNILTDDAWISFYDVTGRLVFSKQLSGGLNGQSIGLGGLNKGVFWVKIQTGDSVAWKKLIVF